VKTPVCLFVLAAALANISAGQPAPLTGGSWVTLQHGPSFDWPSATGVQPATGPVRNQDILALLSSVGAGDWSPSSGFLWDYRFVPLSPGRMYLLADQACRPECGNLEAVYCEQNRCFSDSLSAIVDLKTDLVDIDGDGALEVVGKECISDCSGVPRYPTFVHSIYKFIDGKGFVDYSAQAADYYREHLLPKIDAARNGQTIESEVERMNAGLEEKRHENFTERGVVFPPVRQVETYKAAAQYAYDDYLRRVLAARSAGVEDALQWLSSKDPHIRELGFQALARIPDPAAGSKLAELARSQDKNLAQTAKSYLELRAKLLRGASK
jgi:hypothetical protein